MARVKQEMAWDADKIRDMLRENDRAVVRGLLAIYKCQTSEEQQVGETTEHNGIGFNAFDARVMTVHAKNVVRYGRLFPNQLDQVRNRLMKYAGQLAQIANHNHAQKVQ